MNINVSWRKRKKFLGCWEHFSSLFHIIINSMWKNSHPRKTFLHSQNLTVSLIYRWCCAHIAYLSITSWGKFTTSNSTFNLPSSFDSIKSKKYVNHSHDDKFSKHFFKTLEFSVEHHKFVEFVNEKSWKRTFYTSNPNMNILVSPKRQINL